MADGENKKNSFRDMILIVLVVIICFGLTIYGIVYLTGKVFSTEEKIEIAKIKEPKVVTNPEDGDIMTFTSKPEKLPEAVPPASLAKPAEPIVPITPIPVPAPVAKPTPKPAPQIVVPTKPKEVAPAPKPAAEKQVAKQPAKPAAAKGIYTVQLMSLTSLKDAEKEATKVKKSCPDVFIQKADLGSKGIWYRVRCGVTDSKDDATKTKNRLAVEFNVKPNVVLNK